ncbi:MAG: hypothetical protein LIR46_10780 [Bacteroidota bacterium]|nr:hypothetical protein [Bacteroidota bacterium]
MASIGKFEIVKKLAGMGQLTVKTGFLGLGTSLVWNETGQNMAVKVREYMPSEVEKLLRIINLEPEALKQALKTTKIEQFDLGNVRLEMLQTKEGDVLVMQLYRFVDFKNQPISDIKTIKGSDAAAIAGLL